MANLINPRDVWSRMTAEQQCAFGVASLAHILGSIGAMAGAEPQRAYEAADFEGFNLMIKTLGQVMGELTAIPLPDLNILGIRTCSVCGCTDNCGCEEGCYWVEENLCSACVGAEPKGEE